MQIVFLNRGLNGFVAHKYKVEGIKSHFSVWFDWNGQPCYAERIDSKGRVYPVSEESELWRKRIYPFKLAGLSDWTLIKQAGGFFGLS